MKSKSKGTGLIFSDTHCPAMHKDAVRFLTEIMLFHEVKWVVINGDLVDNYSLSQFGKAPNAFRDDEELEQTAKQLERLFKLFKGLPVTVTKGNHEDRADKRFAMTDMSRKRIVPFRDVYKLPANWEYVDNVIIPQKQGKILIEHDISRSGETSIAKAQCNTIQGHWHSQFDMIFRRLRTGETRWSVYLGSLADQQHKCLRYAAKAFRTCVGGAMILDQGYPTLYPMITSAKGNWIRRLV